MVARELGVSSKDVREMESRMAAQDMTFDMSSDDESDSQPMAPVLYLQDKTSNFADGIEDDNWEEQAANKLTDAMQGRTSVAGHHPRSLAGRGQQVHAAGAGGSLWRLS